MSKLKLYQADAFAEKVFQATRASARRYQTSKF